IWSPTTAATRCWWWTKRPGPTRSITTSTVPRVPRAPATTSARTKCSSALRGANRESVGGFHDRAAASVARMRSLTLLLTVALAAGGCFNPNKGCQPKTCQELGKSCGTVDDGCGAALACGSCAGGESCGADNVCAS